MKIARHLLLLSLSFVFVGCDSLYEEDKYTQSREANALHLPGSTAAHWDDRYPVPALNSQGGEFHPSLVPPGSILDKAFNPDDVIGAKTISKDKTRIVRSGDDEVMLMIRYPLQVAWPSVAGGLYSAGYQIVSKDQETHVYHVFVPDKKQKATGERTGSVVEIKLDTYKDNQAKVTARALDDKQDPNQLTKLLLDVRKGMQNNASFASVAAVKPGNA